MKETRTIVVRLSEEPIPDLDLRGFCLPDNEPNSYIVWVNGQMSEEQKEETFLHEMLHLYHRDNEQPQNVQELEYKRHATIDRFQVARS